MPAASDVRPGIADRLSRLIQQPTVSAERDSRGDEPFDALVALLPELYPLIHAQLALETHGPAGLLYRWQGAHPTALSS